MSPEQIELARHALGLPNVNRQSYRNRFFSGPPNHQIWLAMVADGNAVRTPGKAMDKFTLTKQGALAALKPGERLDDEDFPS